MRNQAFHGMADSDVDAAIASDEWVMQQKFDGTRCLVHVKPGGQVEFRAGNEQLLKHSAAMTHFHLFERDLARVAQLAVDDDVIFDSELVHYSRTLWLFDCLQVPGRVSTAAAQQWRRDWLEAVGSVCGPTVRVVPEARTPEQKRRMLDEVRRAQGEGVMMKRRSAPYDSGQRVTHSLKIKFTKTVDAIVTERDVGGGCNARLAVYDGDSLRAIGGCSMIGKPDAQPGDVVEVRYLYATEALVVYQPTLTKIRTDKAPTDCHLDQLTPVDRHLVVEP